MRILLLLAACAFAGGFALRIVDPIVLPVALAFGIPVTTAALLATAYALPYALAQPFLGTLGDRLGKTRLVRLCIAGLALSLAAGALAPSFAFLIASRVAAGIFGGGLIPLVLASVGDRVPLAGRHAALGRMLFAVISGQMLGSAVSGVVAGAFGWTAVLATAAGVALAVAVPAWLLLPAAAPDATGAGAGSVADRYRAVFANPRTRWVYGAVFVEGILFFGLFPYMGEILVSRGAADAAGATVAAGAVLGAFGIGGLVFAAAVGRLLRAFGTRTLCIGGTVVASGALAVLAAVPTWPLAAAAMAVAGLAFYMLHSTLQTEATELAPASRGTSFALFAGSFFLGQGAGPMAVGAVLHAAGARPTLLAIAALTAVLGSLIVRRVVRPIEPPSA